MTYLSRPSAHTPQFVLSFYLRSESKKKPTSTSRAIGICPVFFLPPLSFKLQVDGSTCPDKDKDKIPRHGRPIYQSSGEASVHIPEFIFASAWVHTPADRIRLSPFYSSVLFLFLNSASTIIGYRFRLSCLKLFIIVHFSSSVSPFNYVPRFLPPLCGARDTSPLRATVLLLLFA
jgi:hypothetical protein